MIELNFNEYRIQCINEPAYKVGSMDNTFQYRHIYEEGSEHIPTMHGVKIYKNEQLINSIIVAAVGGSTAVHETGMLIDNNNLLLCCANYVFCLALPALSLIWKVQADIATCFEIFAIPDGYIIHGELEITRLDKNGNIVWQTGGNDIFVSPDGKNGFTVSEDQIIATDWNNKIYRMDWNGKEIINED
ncbi:hypothetical protein ACFGVR_11275 [Mucilaginibacter sp. AW1-3]